MAADATYDTLLAETSEGVLTLTLNRPDVFNAINAQMSRELAEALKGAGRGQAVRAVVIRGSGRAFCAGQDLTTIPTDAEGVTAFKEKRPARFTGA